MTKMMKNQMTWTIWMIQTNINAGNDAINNGSNDVLAQIEKLAKLKEAGVLSDEEFAEKKAELLAKL